MADPVALMSDSDCYNGSAAAKVFVDGSGEPATAAKLTVEITAMPANLFAITANATSEQNLLDSLVEYLQKVTSAEWLGVLQRQPKPTDELSCIRELPGGLRCTIEDWARVCLRFGQHALKDGKAAIAPLPTPTSNWIVAVPIPGRDRDCLLARFKNPKTPLEQAQALQLVACQVSLWDATRLNQRTQQEADQLAALSDLISQLESCSDPQDACRLLVNRLQVHLACDQVIIGLCVPGSTRFREFAVSGVSIVDSMSEPIRLAEAVLQESIARGEFSSWPTLGDSPRHALRVHRQFSELVNAPVVSIALRGESNEVCGAWLMVGKAEVVHGARAMGFALASRRPLASVLRLLERSRLTPTRRLMLGLNQLWHHRRRGVISAFAGLTLAAMFLPIRYDVDCNCEVQPVTRRFVAAPFDGQLERTLVEPGDVVAKDQLLARLDGREFRWELAGTEADLHRAAKELAGHQVAHESGKMQLAQLELERLRMRNQLLSHRVNNLEVRSPIDGLVIVGDLKRSEGMPVAIGQTLFEIAPLDEMLVEVAIPEDDVRLIQSGMSVRIWLDALPMQSWDATVERIHPRAELKDHENVFVAEINLHNTDGKLRPGMRGSARLATTRHALGWNLFHKAWAATLKWLGW